MRSPDTRHLLAMAGDHPHPFVQPLDDSLRAYSPPGTRSRCAGTPRTPCPEPPASPADTGRAAASPILATNSGPQGPSRQNQAPARHRWHRHWRSLPGSPALPPAATPRAGSAATDHNDPCNPRRTPPRPEPHWFPTHARGCRSPIAPPAPEAVPRHPTEPPATATQDRRHRDGADTGKPPRTPAPRPPSLPGTAESHAPRVPGSGEIARH